MEMSLACSSSSVQFGSAARPSDNPEGELMMPLYFLQARRTVGSHEEWAGQSGVRQTPPFSVLLQSQKDWKHEAPGFPLAHGWLNETSTLNHFPVFVPFSSLVHLGLEERGMQLYWPDSHESSKFVICFCVPNNFSWLSTGKVTQILVLNCQNKQWHLRSWTNGCIVLRCDRCETCLSQSLFFPWARLKKP